MTERPEETPQATPADAGAPVEPEAVEPAAALTPNLMIEIFTADRDVPCPQCRYNLRGAVGPNCPECGVRLEVGLVAGRRGVLAGGVALAVLLALTWVLVATGMNAARTGHEIVETARAAAMMTRPRVMVIRSSSSFSFSSTFGGSVNVGNGGTSSVTQMNPDGSKTTTVTKSDGSTTVTTTLPNGKVINGPAPASNAPAAPTYLWNAVPPLQWGMLGWWGALSMNSLLGLLVAGVLVIRRGGEWGGLMTKVMAVWAAVVFVSYGGYHVVRFVQDVSTW